MNRDARTGNPQRSHQAPRVRRQDGVARGSGRALPRSPSRAACPARRAACQACRGAGRGLLPGRRRPVRAASAPDLERGPGAALPAAEARNPRALRRRARRGYRGGAVAAARPALPRLGGPRAQGARDRRRSRSSSPATATAPVRSVGFHPMREPSGVVAGGVELSAQRPVPGRPRPLRPRDVRPRLRTARASSRRRTPRWRSSPRTLRLVVFTEQVAQTCWFFFGPHLRDGGGSRAPSGRPRLRARRTGARIPSRRSSRPSAATSRRSGACSSVAEAA